MAQRSLTTWFFGGISLFLFSMHGIFANSGQIMTPPKGWESIDDALQLPQKVKVIFIGTSTSKSPFSPSINVACEETTLTQERYVSDAKTYHEGQSQTKCTLVGKFETESGTATLLQIDRPSQWGEIRFIQAILVHSQDAYVVTATCLKQDFSALSSQLFKSIRSLNISRLSAQSN